MPLSDATIRERLAAHPWTAYNIRLSDAVETIPGDPDFFTTSLRLAAVLRALKLAVGENLRGIRAADLACLEGGFALALARLGARTLGLDARSGNIERAKLLQEHFELPNLEFAVGDARDFTLERHGRFDVVLALGLLYHLDDPVRWLRQVADTTRLLILDTHVASDDAALEGADPVIIARLGPIETIEVDGASYSGRWYAEPVREDPTAYALSSFGNAASFWLTPESLLRALEHAGFDVVAEQHDAPRKDYRRVADRLQIIAARVYAGSRHGEVSGDRAELARLRETVEEIASSRAWRAITTYRTVVRRFMPPGSRRQRLLRKLKPGG